MAEHLIPIERAQEDLVSCAAFLAEDIKSSDGHAEAMKQIVPYFVAGGDVDLAAQLADTVDDPFTRDRLLTRVAEKCAAIDDDEYAFQLVEAIEDYGTQAQARERIALQKSAKGDFERALEVADTLDHPDNVLAEIAVHSYEKGNFEIFSQSVRKIEYPAAKATALQTVGLFVLQQGDASKAVGMFEKALEAAEDIDFSEEKIRSLTEIGHHFIEAGRSDRASEVFERAKSIAVKLENIHREVFLAGIALGFFKTGNIEMADRTLDLVDDKTQIASCLVGFAREHWEKGEKAEALETLEESYAILKSQHEKETRDSRAKFQLFGTIAVQFASFEKAERAIEIAQHNPDEQEQMAALARIAQVLSRQENDEMARQAVQAIAEDSQRMFALIGVSDAKNRLGKREEALEILSEAAHLAETVPQYPSRSAAFNALAQRFIEFGELDRAREISHENLETIASIRSESSQVVCLADLGELYEKAGFSLTEAEKLQLLNMIRRAEW